MSGSVNKVILVGHLGRDPEVKTFQSGGRVVSFSLATTESWRDKNSGERKDRTEWHNITIFNEGIGKTAEQYLCKGSKVYIEGQLQTRTYTDRDNAERKIVEVVLKPYRGEMTILDGKNDSAGEDGASQRKSRASKQRDAGDAGDGGNLSGQLNDEIPF